LSAIIIDTETTGHEPPEVIELAYNAMEGVHDIVTDVKVQRFASNKPSALGALTVHHILDSERDNLPLFDLKSVPAVEYWIGHNIDYDWKACGSPPVKRICTLALSRFLWPDLDSHKLGALVYFFSASQATAREQLRDAHSADADVLFCRMVLRRAMDELQPLSFKELYAWSEKARVPTKMAFGKHRGMAIADLPHAYKTWMLKQPDMDPYVLQAVRESL